MYARDFLLICLLIPLPKPTSGVRPIAIGEMFVRASSSWCMKQIKQQHLSDHFLPLQYGVGVPNGCETVVHTIQQALTHPTSPHFVLSIDMKNAFNSVPRPVILAELFKHPQFSPLFHLAHFMYFERTPLAVVHDGKVERIDNLDSATTSVQLAGTRVAARQIIIFTTASNVLRLIGT